MDERFSVRRECDLSDVESAGCLRENSSGAMNGGGIEDWEDGGGSRTEVAGWSSGAAGEAAVPGAEIAASSDEFREESSGFAIRRPPNDCERLRSPSMMGKRPVGSGKRREGERGGGILVYREGGRIGPEGGEKQ